MYKVGTKVQILSSAVARHLRHMDNNDTKFKKGDILTLSKYMYSAFRFKEVNLNPTAYFSNSYLFNKQNFKEYIQPINSWKEEMRKKCQN